MTPALAPHLCSVLLAATPASECPAFGAPDVVAILRPIRERHGIPAIVAALATSRGIVTSGGAGVRKRGEDVPISERDLWHLGSCTKAMTAALMARLVEKGALSWDRTTAAAFPGMAANFNAGFRETTIAHLLAHRAGLKKDLTWRDLPGADDIRAARREVVRRALADPPASAPGEAYLYSNLGYVIAGAMIEAATGRTWEECIREMVFDPLGMNRAGFGGTGTPGRVDQPWPHLGNGRPAPANGPTADNPPVIGPAGRVHCTLQDWAMFVVDQLRGARGMSGLLQPATYLRLHTPPPGAKYAFGWEICDRAWGGGKVLNHTGSNAMNFANVWMAPAKDFAVLVCVNQGGDTAFKATDEAAAALIGLHQRKLGQP